MESHILLMQIAVILVTARVFAEIAAYFHSPRVIGELCAGIVLGPSILGFISPSDPIQILAEIGIILLLFKVGLETDLGHLVMAGRKAVILAIAGFVTPLFLGFGVCYFTFGLPLLVSFFVGGTLTATSIGITVRILTDLEKQRSAEGQIVLGAAVIDDLLGVMLLAVLYDFSVTGSVSLNNILRILLFLLVFFALAPVIAKLFSNLIHKLSNISDAPGLIPVTMVSLVLGFAVIAQAMGAPELLGGFAAGIALSRRFFLPFGLMIQENKAFNRQVRTQMQPIIQLFTPIFFVMVGLSLDLSAVDWSSAFIWIFSLVITVVAIVSKLMGGLLVPDNHYTRVAVGMAMVPRGEVGLIFAELGRTSGILNQDIYAATIIVIAYTTLLSPFWIKSYYRAYGHLFTLENRDKSK